jgi:hypothetical protein
MAKQRFGIFGGLIGSRRWGGSKRQCENESENEY